MNPAQDTQEPIRNFECSLEDGERARSWPHFLADNAPTIITYTIGAIMLYYFHVFAALAYVVYCVVSTVFIWKYVCTHCQYFGGVCQCGFSVAATRLFKKGDESGIENRKKLLAALVIPCWMAPPLTGICLLVVGFSWTLLWLFLAFAIMAFAITPYISWKIGCCDIWRYFSRSK